MQEEMNKSVEEELLLGEDQQEQEIEEVDYSSFSKEELLSGVKEIRNSDMAIISVQYPQFKSAYDALFSTERKEALARFVSEGGVKQDFEYRLDDISKEFTKLTEEFSQKIKDFGVQQKELQFQASKKKEQVVETLRELVSSSEVSNHIFKQVKELQQTWKEANEVTQSGDRELWRSYKGLLDIFYNNRNISFELLDLDRKKNLVAKEELIKVAEGLLKENSIKEIINVLNQCHQDWKLIGPVPEDVRESLWDKFKAITQKVYEHRDHLQAEYDKLKEANLELRQAVIVKLKELISSDLSKISEWNERTKEVQKLQDEWNAIGAVPRDKSKGIANEFWGVVKGFFRNKGEFFNQLDAERGENLKAKEVLCEKVEVLKDEENFKLTADKIKQLQADWKKIGPVSQKQSDAIYKRFRTACDYFFDRRKEFFNEKDKEYVENGKVKEALIKKIEELKEDDIEGFKAIVVEWDTVGFVSRDSKEKITTDYKKATNAFLEKVKEGAEKDELEITVELGGLKGNPRAADIVFKKKDQIRKEISKFQDEINTLKTNIEFFARSKNADGLRAEVEGKIEVANAEIKELKRKMQLINKFEF